MEKRISINIERVSGLGDQHLFKITQMHNAATVSFPQEIGKAKHYGVGDNIPLNLVNDFARDKRWESTVKLGK